jgi:hypothetical protein
MFDIYLRFLSRKDRIGTLLDPPLLWQQITLLSEISLSRYPDPGAIGPTEMFNFYPCLTVNSLSLDLV